MKSCMVPGYTWLFQGEPYSHDEYLKAQPSETVIAVAIMMNNELETSLQYDDQQERIFNAITFRFTTQQKQYILDALQFFKLRTNGMFSEDIFRREYFMKLILKETRRKAMFELTDLSAQQEFNFFMAYLVLIDEINKADFELLEELRAFNSDPSNIYVSLWTPNLSKYQFNERVSPAFELFKLGCLAKHAFENWRIYLKEYLNLFGLSTIGNLMHFFNTGINSALHFEKDKIITDLSYVVPNTKLTIDPFSTHSINSLIEKEKKVELSDLKLFPLFHNRERGYMVIDKNFYFKKIYRGPFFELLNNTGLRPMGFNKYSGDVSKKVIEKICFQGIIKVLVNDEYDVLYFDNTDKDGMPDCYIRKGNIAFLLECKAYVVPEKHLTQIEKGKAIERFEEFKNYLNDRFINSKGSAKGITQLKNQVVLLKEESKCEFDKDFFELFSKEEVSIYPIICHNDFNFTMPGINNYLNEKFIDLIEPLKEVNLKIKDMTFIGMDCLFDLVLRQGNVDKLHNFLERYWQNFLANKSNDNSLKFSRSFDEFYFTKYVHELPELATIPYQNH